MRRGWMLAALALLGASAAPAQEQRKTPYWVSVASGEAMMRTGPGRNYPATWLYRRADLPVKVVEVYPSWRKIEDPDGTTGWMLVALLSERRTALVTGSEPRPIRKQANDGAAIVYRAEPGVVGRISKCGGGWCRIEIGRKAGFIAAGHIWGVDPGEALP